MTKINSSAPTYLKHRTGFQYSKSRQVGKSHAIFQSYNSDMNATVIQEMTQDVPDTGNFSSTPLYTVSSTWTAGTAYAIGDVVLPTTNNGMFYECIIAGTSHATTEPTWTTTNNSRYSDGTVTWIARIGDLLGKFVSAPDGCIAYANGKHSLIWGGDEFRIAKFINYDPTLVFSYDYTEMVNNELSDTLNTAVLHRAADNKTYAYLGSTLPGISGIKFYINKANTAVSSPTIYYWNGSAWVTVGTVTDGTKSSTVSMAQTGTMTFTAPTTTNKLKMINNLYLYWLKIEWGTLDTTTSIYYVTTKTTMQPVTDIWDGSSTDISVCQTYTVAGGYSDQTINIIKNDYSTGWDGTSWISPPETYLNMASFATNSYIYIGSVYKLTGLYFLLPTDQVNTTAASMTVSYWSGSAWTSVGTLDDQTLGSTTDTTLNNSGYVLWNSPSIEYRTHVSTSTELYYYRIGFDAVISTLCKIDHMYCIPTQDKIYDYNFALMWLNRLFYCGNKSRDKNKILGSASFAPSVFNGSDRIERYIGTNEELIAGATLFSRYGTELSETMLITKLNETWILSGTDPQNIVMYCVSKKYGCNAPHTMQVCDLGFEIAPGVNKAVAIWQSNNGLVMFDNGSIISIDQDIQDKFERMSDSTYSTRLNGSYANISQGFYDPTNKEYHWLYAEGSSTSINAELVYDITRKKWYKINRGSLYLKCGLSVMDTIGNHYTYGAIDTGYVERLEYGTSMDGNAITYALRTADKPLYTSMMIETLVRHVKVIGVAKSSADNITIYHYIDTALVPKTFANTIDQNVSSIKRIYSTENSRESNGTFHSFRLYGTVDDCYSGFEPLAIGILYKITRYDTVGG